jgi:hypothetical protein
MLRRRGDFYFSHTTPRHPRRSLHLIRLSLEGIDDVVYLGRTVRAVDIVQLVRTIPFEIELPAQSSLGNRTSEDRAALPASDKLYHKGRLEPEPPGSRALKCTLL